MLTRPLGSQLRYRVMTQVRALGDQRRAIGQRALVVVEMDAKVGREHRVPVDRGQGPRRRLPWPASSRSGRSRREPHLRIGIEAGAAAGALGDERRGR